MTLSQWFSHKTAAFYTEQCTSHRFFTSRFELVTEELWLHLQCHFLGHFVHRALSNKLLTITQDH